LALLSIQRKEEAFEFVKRIMTVRGIADSPNGQPAMYEYRRSDEENERLHGKVDKPQFLWAAGWTLYTVYHILGLRENVWNVSLDPFLPDRSETVCFTIMLKGKPIQVCVKGRGTAVQTIAFDGKSNPSLVIPETPSVEKTIDVTFGEPESPYLTQAHSMVRSCAVQKQRLTVNLEAFPGHRSGLRVISPVQPERIVQNGKEIPLQWKAAVVNGIVAVNVDFIHENTVDCIELSF
jgi:hypothetical protein